MISRRKLLGLAAVAPLALLGLKTGTEATEAVQGQAPAGGSPPSSAALHMKRDIEQWTLSLWKQGHHPRELRLTQSAKVLFSQATTGAERIARWDKELKVTDYWNSPIGVIPIRLIPGELAAWQLNYRELAR